MKAGWLIALGFTGGIVVCGIGLRLRSVTADVPPPNERMFYAGELREGGAPATGPRDIEVRFHSAATGSGNQICTSNLQPGTPLVDGHFRINVGSACVTALAMAQNAYVEVVVGGVSLPPSTTPRPRVAAVPYAAQAATLSSALPAADVVTAAGPTLEARLADLEARLAPMPPPGTIIAFAGPTVPAGWLLCDGSAVSRSAFQPLFSAIGTSWGGGDGTTTFNLPDLRGRFLRGVDGTAGNDPDAEARSQGAPGGNTGNAVGSIQSDALVDHYHNYRSGAGVGQCPALTQNCPTEFPGFQTSGVRGVPASTETRPKNASVTFIIRS